MGEKRSSDLSSRLSVKRGGKLISKTLGKSSSPPSISAPPKAAVGASKVKKDEVQRHKNSFHDMLRGSSREKDGGNAVPLNVPVSGATPTSQNHGARGNPATTIVAADRRKSPDGGKSTAPEHDRLAELEKALAAAREETAALRHELDRVKQDAQASAEVSRYQAQHTSSEDAEMQTDSPNGLLAESSNDDLELESERQSDLIAQINALRYHLAEVQDQLLSQSSHHPEPHHSESDWNALTLRLHETEKESYARLQQLLSLKSSISSLTRTDSQASDSELAEALSQLANRVREWVVSNYRRSKMDLVDLPEASVRVLRAIKTDYVSIDGAQKLPLYQAIVSSILMQIFDEPLVVGLPNEHIYAGLRAFAESAQSSGVELREWKRVTLQVMERSTQAATIRSWRDQQLASLTSQLENVMSSISSTDITPNARLSLAGIWNAAMDLQRILCLQKAGYSVIFFNTRDGEHRQFDDRAMESINDLEERMDDDSEPYVHRDFGFCVFPCLLKVGENMENIVFKARVCCGVG